MTNVLDINNLEVSFKSDGKEVKVVNGISFSIGAGETVGVVGESGCGKSVTSLSIMRLIPSPPGRISGGEILYKGENLLDKKEREMRKIRGNEISMIFQEPMTSLNPVFTIGKQINEVLLLHKNMNQSQARKKSIEMLELVGIPRAEQIYDSHPFELSGGMRQRVMIAIGLACEPQLLIADEPTTALDVTIQAQILDLMRGLKDKTNTAIMFITHDLGVVAEMCDRVVVMYSGEIVEQADVDTLFNDPKHPYTVGLLGSLPKVEEKQDRLFSIPGQVPPPGSVEQGCRFAGRCQHVMPHCTEEDPPLLKMKDGHSARCWLYAEEHRGKEVDIHDKATAGRKRS
ncbi:peptide ABC transporter ATP-binding protein [Alteribacter lacisalsi]|jgi:peptide/nickel transport system ATP-binding protein|uniref:Peptide ABC transporter ATP-binding protein n=1 Tax=Alteribacter lacisalsi TaxID=2045244 RepID=A0A2W0HUP3_9BACI|nr:ABC transporter ATP-binding protein [Alteribacter lacisalsi]PYZ97378.1 peptide ABC transporter ATP-binding protein [Alteribacter lacisalsi]